MSYFRLRGPLPTVYLLQFQITSLKKQLRNRSALLGDGVSRAFLRALVQLIGGYRDALRFQPGEQVTFDQEKFIETRPLSLQPFLREMLNLQIFRQVCGLSLFTFIYLFIFFVSHVTDLSMLFLWSIIMSWNITV